MEGLTLELVSRLTPSLVSLTPRSAGVFTLSLSIGVAGEPASALDDPVAFAYSVPSLLKSACDEWALLPSSVGLVVAATTSFRARGFTLLFLGLRGLRTEPRELRGLNRAVDGENMRRRSARGLLVGPIAE